MRDYAKVAPQFWTGKTGKALKAAGPEAVIVGMYLMTSPHANMIGVYHCPLAYIAIDTGLTLEGASKGLRSAIEADFCRYEQDTEFVFVHEFACYQIGDSLKADDNRVKGVLNELAKVPKGECWQGFRARYAEPFNLPCESNSGPKKKAPSKPLRSQEQEQEQKKEKDFLLPDWIPVEQWQAFVAMRKAKGSRTPFTDAARDGIVQDLEKMRVAGHDVADALRRSVINGWSGVFEPKVVPVKAAANDLAEMFRRGAA